MESVLIGTEELSSKLAREEERERCLQLLHEMSDNGVSYMDVHDVAVLREAIRDGWSLERLKQEFKWPA